MDCLSLFDDLHSFEEAGPHAVSSTVSADYGGFLYTASCSGSEPVENQDWNLIQNTSCSDGFIRLLTDREAFIQSNLTLTFANVSFEPAGARAEDD